MPPFENASFVNLTVVECRLEQKKLYIQEFKIYVQSLQIYMTDIRPSLILWRNFTRKEPFFLQNGLLKPKN
jgi:hypothetical protein